MNPNRYRNIPQLSGLRFWLILLGVGWLLGTAGLRLDCQIGVYFDCGACC